MHIEPANIFLISGSMINITGYTVVNRTQLNFVTVLLAAHCYLQRTYTNRYFHPTVEMRSDNVAL
jgi:hypothetical protein